MTKPFQILKGGYQIIFKNGKWSEVFVSDAKKKAFAKEDRRGHRSERRAQRAHKRAEAPRIRAAEKHARALANR